MSKNGYALKSMVVFEFRWTKTSVKNVRGTCRKQQIRDVFDRFSVKFPLFVPLTASQTTRCIQCFKAKVDFYGFLRQDLYVCMSPGINCNSSYDSVYCWPTSPSNTLVSISCSDIITQLPSHLNAEQANAYRICDSSGQWLWGNWSNYSECLGLLDLASAITVTKTYYIKRLPKDKTTNAHYWKREYNEQTQFYTKTNMAEV
uniref:G-protein coupled receptors family 2 profile 1 domain-containing protein n=1 Tax=Strigamia maritima TaxID=126957 RepID=T1JMX8_STRMM